MTTKQRGKRPSVRAQVAAARRQARAADRAAADAARVAFSTELNAELRAMRGHPALTAWEEAFVASLDRQSEARALSRLSGKQRAILDALRLKITAPLIDGEAEELDNA